MILPDHEILKCLKEGKIVVEPLGDPDLQIQPAWIDLRLGNEFRTFKIIGVPFIDTRVKTENYTERHIIPDGESFIIHPGEFVLGTVLEYIKLPSDIMGSVDGQSSLGRMGLVVHTTSSSINPGWEGRLVLEMANIGKMPIKIYPGSKICKITFHRLSSPAKRPYDVRKESKYNRQKEIAETRVYEEKY